MPFEARILSLAELIRLSHKILLILPHHIVLIHLSLAKLISLTHHILLIHLSFDNWKQTHYFCDWDALHASIRLNNHTEDLLRVNIGLAIKHCQDSGCPVLNCNLLLVLKDEIYIGVSLFHCHYNLI